MNNNFKLQKKLTISFLLTFVKLAKMNKKWGVLQIAKFSEIFLNFRNNVKYLSKFFHNFKNNFIILEKYSEFKKTK